MSQYRQAVSRVARALLVVLLLAGCATSQHRAAQAGGARKPPPTIATALRTFAPYTTTGRPARSVTAHHRGSCFTSSITVAAARAYRCFAANTILDPCVLVPGSRHDLDCFADPWARPVQLRVARLPSPTVSRLRRPWAIELAGGTRCVVTNGTASIVRGVAMGYACQGSSGGTAGLQRTTGTVLHALYRAEDGAVRTVRVAIAWRPAVA